MRSLATKLLAVIVICGGMMSAQTASSNEKPKVIPSFDLSALDKKADPCADFYQFSCGGWTSTHPIPADQSSWGRFNELNDNNLAILRDILEKDSADTPGRIPIDAMIGNYYAACMDETAINAKGIAVLKPELDRIAALNSKQDLVDEIAHLHSQGAAAFFDFGSGQDFKDSTSVIAQADQGGLGLPDRDYYFKFDDKSKEQRQKYVDHVRNMFQLLGDSPEQAEVNAAVVLDVETKLAKGAFDRVKRREPANVYHKISTTEFAGYTPAFTWTRYFNDLGMAPVASLNVTEPEYFKNMNTVLQGTSLDDLKAYLRWHLVHSSAALLPTTFVNESFNFYGKTLRGTKELRPRWKRCVSLTDNQLGEALGQSYVARTFGAEGKARTLKMVDALEKALNKDISELAWMTPATRKEALVKLKGIANKIGYPEKWRDYSSVQIDRIDPLGNSARADAFEFKRQLDKIGKPVDKLEWGMTPPTVNAYYDPQMNNINFPAGILQPPFYDNAVDDAVNFGGIGAVIGHELTHGFDDEGRQFDAQGNLRDWWTKTDADEFSKRAQCVADEYSGFVAVKDVKDSKDDVHLNGKLTLGENTADNGGVRIAYMALEDVLQGKDRKLLDGFTPEQRFFIGFGQIWCENTRPETERLMALTNEHSPGKYRVNGVMQNNADFQKAFSCRSGQAMVAANGCHVW